MRNRAPDGIGAAVASPRTFMKRARPARQARPERASWLVPALVAAVVALLTSAATGMLQQMKDTADNQREIVRIRAEVLKAAGEAKSLAVAKVLLDHVLKPIDSQSDRAEFARQVEEYISSLAAVTARGTGERSDLASVGQPATGDIPSLLAKFEGPDRLAASNALVERARTDKQAVVGALVGALRQERDKLDYRVNLYIVFTLGRLAGGWQGTASQIERVRALEKTAMAKDPTFKARLQEALQAAAL